MFKISRNQTLVDFLLDRDIDPAHCTVQIGRLQVQTITPASAEKIEARLNSGYAAAVTPKSGQVLFVKRV